MHISPSKDAVLSFTLRSVANVHLTVQRRQIAITSSQMFLGVMLDPQLTGSKHVDMLVQEGQPNHFCPASHLWHILGYVNTIPFSNIWSISRRYLGVFPSSLTSPFKHLRYSRSLPSCPHPTSLLWCAPCDVRGASVRRREGTCNISPS